MTFGKHDFEHRYLLLRQLSKMLDEMRIPHRYPTHDNTPALCSDARYEGRHTVQAGMPYIELSADLGRVRVVHDEAGDWFYIWPDWTHMRSHPNRHDHAGELAGRIAIKRAEAEAANVTAENNGSVPSDPLHRRSAHRCYYST